LLQNTIISVDALSAENEAGFISEITEGRRGRLYTPNPTSFVCMCKPYLHIDSL